MLAVLSALGLLEHWFLALPVPAQALWGWSLGASQREVPAPLHAANSVVRVPCAPQQQR
jgi:hypothetical protein